jgi:hypothetical protein
MWARVLIVATWQQYPTCRMIAELVAENEKAPPERGFHSAPERTRTSTDQAVHKALNLARLPIPPQARGGRV